MSSFSERRCLRGHSGAVQAVAFNASGSHVLTGGADRVVNLWNPYRPPFAEDAPTGGLLLRQYRGHGLDVRCLAVAADGATFASVGGDRFSIVWDVEKGVPLRKTFGHEGAINAVALAGGGGGSGGGGGGGGGPAVLATGSDDKTVRLCDLRVPPTRAPLQVLRGARDNVTGVAVAGTCVLAASLDGCLRAWDLRAARMCVDELPPGGRALSALAVSHDGACALVASPRAGAAPAALALLETASGAVLNAYEGHANGDFRLQPCLLPGDSHVACGSEDGRVLVWDLVAGAPSELPGQPHGRAVAGVDARVLPGEPPGSGAVALVTGSHDGTAKLWTNASCAEGDGVEAQLLKDPALRRGLGLHQ
jgi:mitogen-activated protein kinase organizer 1